MKRTDRFPETPSFRYHNENPKERITGDCVFRSIAQATGMSWEEVVRSMCEYACKTGYAPQDKKCYARWLKDQGWVMHRQPKKADGSKVTGREFTRVFKGTCIAHIGSHHITCIKDGKINDIWDCSGGRIGNWWTKE